MRNRKNLIFARNKRNNWLYHKTAARPDRRGGGDSEISGFQQEREAGVDLFVGEEGAVTGLDDGGFRRKLQMPGLLQRGEGVGGGTAADKVPHGGDAAAGLQIPDEARHGAVIQRSGLLRVLQQLLLQGKLEFGLSCFQRRILSAC